MRARNIKPGFFLNEELGELGPCAQLLFEGLWCLGDREGRLDDRPKRIKAEIFPYYEPTPTIDELLNMLQSRNFIIRYEVDKKQYIQITNFKKHQSPHVRETASIIPRCDIDTIKAKPRLNQGDCEASPGKPDSLIPDSLIPEEKIISSELQKNEAHEPPPSPILEIPLISKNGKLKTFPIFQKDIDQWQSVFPALDVLARIKLIRQWNIDNPQRRKTARGIKQHITSWLERDQNSGKFKPSAGAGSNIANLNKMALLILECDGAENFERYCIENGLDAKQMKVPP